MTVKYGSKRLVVGAHYGLRDWMVQRATAVLMALFTLVMIVECLMPGPMSYEKWGSIFAHQWMKVLTFVVIASILWHAWVGVRDVLMDYVKQMAARLVLQVAAIVWLVGCAGWALQVLWRI
ncbi:MAG: succinate dehydrogenase, hydrophobic membrane anchor protein [Pseudomonadota bacterium]|nr:succinate dehydrogenase, hydrophobic membrane anchor protein [Pseudomonadota bacterium]